MFFRLIISMLVKKADLGLEQEDQEKLSEIVDKILVYKMKKRVEVSK